MVESVELKDNLTEYLENEYGMDEYEIDDVVDIFEEGRFSIDEAANIVYNDEYVMIPVYEFTSDIWENVAHYMIHDACILEIPEEIEMYFDYQKFGNDLRHDYTDAFQNGDTIFLIL